MASSKNQFDTSIDIVTPENIAFQYAIAGPFQRLPAFAIDVIVRAVFLLVLAIVVACSGITSFFGELPIAITAFLLDWFYGGVFETIWNGQTPGKRMMGLRVVTVDGAPITGTQAVLRNFLRFADIMPLGAAQVGLVVMLITRRYQRMGDLAAGTMVISERTQRNYGVIRITEPEAIRLAAMLPVDYQVTRSLALALSGYIQRRPYLAWPRRAEIARHLGEPLCEKFGLPPDTSHDLLLCALYHKVFIAEQEGDELQFVGPPQPVPIT